MIKHRDGISSTSTFEKSLFDFRPIISQTFFFKFKVYLLVSCNLYNWLIALCFIYISCHGGTFDISNS